ncbi:unnamed protein product [Amoebophrya sp. A120]|nr:unnamed protein product [Amoebophrya sp. A120]|eukprot:GSA120T00001537001.1
MGVFRSGSRSVTRPGSEVRYSDTRVGGNFEDLNAPQFTTAFSTTSSSSGQEAQSASTASSSSSRPGRIMSSSSTKSSYKQAHNHASSGPEKTTLAEEFAFAQSSSKRRRRKLSWCWPRGRSYKIDALPSPLDKDLDEDSITDLSEEKASPRTQLLLRKMDRLAKTATASTSKKTCEVGTSFDVYHGTRTLHVQTESWDCLRFANPPKKTLTPSDEQRTKDFAYDTMQELKRTSSTKSGSEKELQAMRSTVETLNQKLRSRDAQVTNLTSQLKLSRQHLWNERQLAARAEARLRECAEGYGESAESRAVQLLTEKLKSTGEKLNAERMRAMRWALIAKQQRQFFKHTETFGDSPIEITKQKHPAGEIFMPPPPLADEDEDAYGDLWDVGTGAGANPYNVDSWPLEPNVLAQKINKQVPFGEGILEGEDESESEASLQEEDIEDS